MNMNADFPVVVVAIIAILILVGTLFAYPLNPISFGAEIQKDGSSANVTMDSTIESDYLVLNLALDNSEDRKLYIYYDESYESVSGCSDEKEKIDDLRSNLKYFHITPTMIDAGRLKEIITDTSSAKSSSVVIFSGALPSNIYSFDGTAVSDEVLDWMNAGGALYWHSTERFGYYSAPLASTFTNWDDNQPKDIGTTKFGLVFGEGDGYADNRSETSFILGITQNEISKGSPVESPSVINIGYKTVDNRCSVAVAEYGLGCAVLVTGDWTADYSLAKIIGSKLVDWTSYTPEHYEGKFKGSETVRIDVVADAVYVYYGTVMPRFGELFLL